MNDLKKVEIFERDPLMESLLTIEILLANKLNYQVTKIGMGNYYLYENVQPILVSAKKEHEVWMMFFDGSRCRHGCGVGILFKSPPGHMKRFSFKFTWTCTNNVAEYEALCLGLSKAISMGIRCLIFHGDFELVIK